MTMIDLTRPDKLEEFTLTETLDETGVAWLRTLDLADLRKVKKGGLQATRTVHERLAKLLTYTPKAGDGRVVQSQRKYWPAEYCVRSGGVGSLRMLDSRENELFAPLKAVLFASHSVEMTLFFHGTLAALAWIAEAYAGSCHKWYALREAADDPASLLEQVSEGKGCTHEQAEGHVRAVLFTHANKRMHIGQSLHLLRKLRDEACLLQHHLHSKGDFEWLAGVCKGADNPAGALVRALADAVCTRVTLAVKDRLLAAGHNVSCLTGDGLVVDGEADDELLRCANAVCEEACPGFRARWGWRPFDAQVYDEGRPTGRLMEVPPDFGEPEPIAELELDREHPGYDELFEEVSKFCVQVGTNFINECVQERKGQVVLFDERNLRVWFRTWRYWTVEEVKKFDENQKTMVVVGHELVDHDFFEKWLIDPRRNARFLPASDAHKATVYDFFGVHPDPAKCPPNCYNTWTPFAAEDMPQEHTVEVAERVVHVLTHLWKGCNKHEASYNFLLDLIAHSLIHPTEKPCIMLCLCGVKGGSKTTVWELIQRLVGKHKTFQTGKPERDCWGDNNGAMIGAYWVRLTEMSKKNFQDCLGEMKTHITDADVRVRELYCKACNIPSVHRFFADSNWPDCFPDEDGERRFFILWWVAVELGNREYYTDLYDNHIHDDRVIEALFQVLVQRPVPRRLTADDIVVTEFQQQVKDCNRRGVDRFLARLVEEQPLDKGTLTLTADEVVEKYNEWQSHGHEFERSKSAILKELDLCQLPGITRSRVVCRQSDGHKVVTRYSLDLAKLRVRYRIDQDIAKWQQAQEEGERQTKRRREEGSSSAMDAAARGSRDVLEMGACTRRERERAGEEGVPDLTHVRADIDIRSYVYEALGLMEEEVEEASRVEAMDELLDMSPSAARPEIDLVRFDENGNLRHAFEPIVKRRKAPVGAESSRMPLVAAPAPVKACGCGPWAACPECQ